jgi:hypothetical protein
MTTMMTYLLPDLGRPTMKSIEISHQIEGGIGSGWSVPRDLNVSPYCVDIPHIQPQRFIHHVSYHPQKIEHLTHS